MYDIVTVDESASVKINLPDVVVDSILRLSVIQGGSDGASVSFYLFLSHIPHGPCRYTQVVGCGPNGRPRVDWTLV